MENIDQLTTAAVDLAMRFAHSCQERHNLTLSDLAFRAVLPTFLDFVVQDVESAPLRTHILGAFMDNALTFEVLQKNWRAFCTANEGARLGEVIKNADTVLYQRVKFALPLLSNRWVFGQGLADGTSTLPSLESSKQVLPAIHRILVNYASAHYDVFFAEQATVLCAFASSQHKTVLSASPFGKSTHARP